MTRPIVLLVNPASGRGRSVAAAQALADRIRPSGIPVTTVSGSSVNDARAALADVVHDQRPAAVIACGGDGTVHLALQSVASSDIALGILPVGTGNDNAGALGLSSDPAQAAQVILDFVGAGVSRVVDAGRASVGDDARWFLGVLSSGFDS